MKYLPGWLAICLFVPLALPAHALSGNDILQDCAEYDTAKNKQSGSVQEAYDTGSCFGYIAGAADYARDVPVIPGLCVKLPRGATYNQIVAVVIKWLKDHPQELHQSGHFLVYRALFEAWPCPK
jgi:hypothetical protein